MFFKYNLFAFLWAIVLLFLSLIGGGGRTNIEFSLLDKLIHVVIYGVFTLLLVIGLSKQYDWVKGKFNAGYYAVIISVLYGTLMEFLQYLAPSRGFDYWDMLANTVGSVLGYLVFVLLYKRF